jgi:hypothetical protein
LTIAGLSALKKIHSPIVMSECSLNRGSSQHRIQVVRPPEIQPANKREQGVHGQDKEKRGKCKPEQANQENQF